MDAISYAEDSARGSARSQEAQEWERRRPPVTTANPSRLHSRLSCENCGIPEGALLSPGQKVKVKRSAKYRTVKHSVWCCSDNCAIQTLATALYGPASHKWPITLAQFRATKPLESFPQVSRRSNPAKTAKLRVWNQ